MDRPLPDVSRPFLPWISALRRARVSLAFFAVLAIVLSPGPAQALFDQYLVNDDDDPNDPNHAQAGEENRFGPAAIPLDSGGFLLLWLDNSWGNTNVTARIFTSLPDTVGAPRIINDNRGFHAHGSLVTSKPGGGVAVAAWLQDPQTSQDLYAEVISTADGSSIGPNILVNDDNGLGVQRSPAAATDTLGRSLICWMDNRISRFGIWGQIIDAEGNPAGANLPLAPESADSVQSSPAVAAVPGGGWLLAWQEQANGFSRIRYRLLEADGTPASAILNATAGGGYDQTDPAILVRSSDALLAWADNRQGTDDVWGQWLHRNGDPDGANVFLRDHQDSSPDLNIQLAPAPNDQFALLWLGAIQRRQRDFIRFFGADRAPIGTETAVSDPDPSILQNPAIAILLQDGRWVLAWDDDRSLTDQVYFQLATIQAGITGKPTQAWFNPGSASQILGDTAMLPGGRAVVVWADVRNASLNVYKRMLDASGVPDGSSSIVNSVPVGQRVVVLDGVASAIPFAPQVAASGTGTFVVTWAINVSGGQTGLYGQLFDPSGAPIGTNFAVGKNVASEFGAHPAMALNGSFAIAWQDDGVEKAGDILVQLYSAAGVPKGNPIDIVDRAARGSQQVTPDFTASSYDFAAAWVDDRNGMWQVFRQRIGLDGTMLDTLNVKVSLLADERFDDVDPAIASDGTHIITVYDHNAVTQGLIFAQIETLESMAVSPGSPGAAPPSLDRRGSPGGQGIAGGASSGPIEIVVNPDDHPLGVKYPQVAIGANGEFVVTWQEISGGVTIVQAQRFDASGNPLPGTYPLNDTDTEGHRIVPNVSANLSRIQYVWTDSRRGQGWDIYSRRVGWNYDGSPTPILLQSWTAVSGSKGMDLRWVVPQEETGADFRVWRDFAAAGTGASPSSKAALLTPGGLQPVQPWVFAYSDTTAPPGQPLLYYLEVRGGGGSEYIGPLAATWIPPVALLRWTAAPNPFRQQILFQPPAMGPARFDIRDVTGRLLRTLDRRAGSDPLIWDGRDSQGRLLPSGIYLGVSQDGGTRIKLVRLR